MLCFLCLFSKLSVINLILNVPSQSSRPGYQKSLWHFLNVVGDGDDLLLVFFSIGIFLDKHRVNNQTNIHSL